MSAAMTSLQAKIDSVAARVDEVLAAKLRREAEALEREEAEQRRADAVQARADSFRNFELAAMFDDAFRSFGEQTPGPISGERPGQFRRRLYERLRRKLPSDHRLADVRADELPSGPAYVNFEAMMIDAAKAEGEHPTVLPDNGAMIERHRVDDMGSKVTEFYGKQSFIADMGRPGRYVARIVDRNSGSVIWGRPLPQAR